MQEVAIAEDERNDGRRAARKAAGAGIGAIVQFVQGALHPFAEVRIDVRTIVHHPRYGAHGYSSTAGHVANRYRHVARPVASVMNRFMKNNTGAKRATMSTSNHPTLSDGLYG